MEALKLFEDWDSTNEGMMSGIDLIFQNADTAEKFQAEVKEFLSKNAHNPEVASSDEFIENLSKLYFDEDGTKRNEI